MLGYNPKTHTPAHFSAHELRLLDEAQGGRVHNSAGIPTYDHLWMNYLNHTPVKEMLKEHSREEYNKGGVALDIIRRIKSNGIHGDREIGIVPHGMSHLLDDLIGGRNPNPEDGYPQYYELSNKLKPLLDMIKGGMSNMGNSLYGGMQRFGNAIRNQYHRAYNYFNPSPLRAAGAYEPLLEGQPENWRDWGSRMVNENVRSPMQKLGGGLGGALGGYLGNRGAAAVNNMIPAPSFLTHLAGTAYGGYRGYNTGRNAANRLTDLMAQGAGMAGQGIDRALPYIPPQVKAAPAQISAFAQRNNPWSHNADFINSIRPQAQVSPTLSSDIYEQQWQQRAGQPLIDDVD